MPESSPYITRFTSIVCALSLIYCLISNSFCGPQEFQDFHLTVTPRTAVEVSSRSPKQYQKNAMIKDFYKFYSRDVEASAWGSELPINSHIPKSGLGIFIILWTRSDEKGQQQIKRCLQSLDVFFNDRFDYPILILHEDLTQEIIDTVRTWTRSRIEFVGHCLIDSEYLKVFQHTGFKMFEQAPGYLDMIRTNIYRWPLHRALFGYRYVFKLDSDAALVERIDVDMFEDMKSRDIKAAYVTSIMSSKIMSEKLYETAEDILRYNMLKPAQDLDRMPKLWTWYGYAFVFDTAFARSPAYLNTVWHFDNVHGVFKHRWGDLQLYLLTSMFLETNQTEQLDIPTTHQTTCVHTKNQSSCTQDISLLWTQKTKSNSTLKKTDWRWNPVRPFDYSSTLWPQPVVAKPPYCFWNETMEEA